MSTFGKIRVEGRDAEAFLNRVCGNEVAVPVGRIVYTQFLNRRGGIEADVTVTRQVFRDGQLESEDHFYSHYLPWNAVFQVAPGQVPDPKLPGALDLLSRERGELIGGRTTDDHQGSVAPRRNRTGMSSRAATANCSGP